MSRSLTLTTGSRLHFGLYAFGRDVQRQFGGVGCLVDVPLRVEFSPADQPAPEPGWHAERVASFMQSWWQYHLEKAGNETRLAQPLPHVTVTEAPEQHIGLGLGTQLGLAVASGLHHWFFNEFPTLAEATQSVNRGRRSAVGSYGFFYGGLIVDQGKRAGEGLSPLQCRLELPDEWRWVLIQPPIDVGLSGQAEQKAFAQLPSTTDAWVQALRRQVDERLIPSLAARDYEGFAETLFRYGRQAGESFAPVQGGAYRTPQIAALVDYIRDLGYPGVGQSSWGPTVFVLTPDEDHAQRLVEGLDSDAPDCFDGPLQDLRIVGSRNRPAMVSDQPVSDGKAQSTCLNSASTSTT